MNKTTGSSEAESLRLMNIDEQRPEDVADEDCRLERSGKDD